MQLWFRQAEFLAARRTRDSPLPDLRGLPSGKAKMSTYRPDVLTNPNYTADEAIDEE
jgi:hypothetical protein